MPRVCDRSLLGQAAILVATQLLINHPWLQTGQPKDCELKRVSMANIRRRLGLEAGGAKALGLLATLAGSGGLDGLNSVAQAGDSGAAAAAVVLPAYGKGTNPSWHVSPSPHADYDLDGAQGVGSIGGLAIARYLVRGGDLEGQQPGGSTAGDDGLVMQRLTALVQVRGSGSHV